MFASQPVNDSHDKTGSHRLGTSDADFPHRRISEKLDVLDALPQLVEDRQSSLDERAAVLRRLDAMGASVQERHSERMLQVSDRPRYRRLRGAEPLSGL